MKTKILIGVLVVGVVLICGWWVWVGQRQTSLERFCTASVLEDCDGKKVNVVGFVVSSKTKFLCDIESRDVKYTWLGNCILISNDEVINKDLVDKKVDAVGVVKAAKGELCGVDRIEQCGGKYYPTEIKIEQIKALENQMQTAEEE